MRANEAAGGRTRKTRCFFQVSLDVRFQGEEAGQSPSTSCHRKAGSKASACCHAVELPQKLGLGPTGVQELEPEPSWFLRVACRCPLPDAGRTCVHSKKESQSPCRCFWHRGPSTVHERVVWSQVWKLARCSWILLRGILVGLCCRSVSWCCSTPSRASMSQDRNSVVVLRCGLNHAG